MMKIGQTIGEHIKLKPKLININNTVFKLHYRITSMFLFLFVSLLCVEEYNNNKIKCTHSDPTDSKKQLEHVVETFCFFMSTYTVVNHHNASTIKDVAAPGVGPHRDHDDVIRHTYYQWVPYVLLLQGIAFYLPHYVWRIQEGGRLTSLVKSFNIIDMLKEEKQREVAKMVQDNFTDRIKTYNTWMGWLVFCEALNLVNLIAQIFLTDWFLGGEFLGLGNYVYDNWIDDYNPLDKIFPKTAKCTFKKFGPSGSIQTHDVLCVLSLNIINEKIYITLWYWYLFVGIVSILMLVHRLLAFALYKTNVKYNVKVFNSVMTLKPDPKDLLIIMKNLSFSEWFFLSCLVTNLDGRTGVALIHAMATDYEENNGFRTDEEVPLRGYRRYEQTPTLRAIDDDSQLKKRNVSDENQIVSEI